MAIPVFPVLRGLTKPIGRKTVWSTSMESSFSGEDARFPNWTYPKYAFTLKFDFLRADAAETDWQALSGFYNQVFGPANLFQYLFSEDGGPSSGVTDQPFGIGDGTTRTFQLVRTMGGFTEPVFLPTSPTIKINGVTTAAYTIDAYGRVTFTVAPGAAAALTWTGTWNWYCRFDADEQDFNNFAFKYWDCQQVNFTTVKILGDST